MVAAREAGDRALAATIRQLRRPTASAWIVNQLVRTRGEDVEELLRLGANLRQAQSQLAGDELRRLSQEGQQLVTRLSAEARQLATEAGQPISDLGLREVEDTLHAVLADAGASETVRSGCLTTALRYSGFGLAADLSDDQVSSPSPSGPAPARTATARPDTLPAPTRPRAGRPHPPPGEARAGGGRPRTHQEIEGAKLAVREAQQELVRARREAAEHGRRVERAEQQEERLRQRIAQISEQLEQLRAEELAAGIARRDATRTLRGAERTVRSLEARLEQARYDLDRGRSSSV
jgi:hypothetical protein